MMLVLAVLYDIPELNLGFHFYLRSDEQDEERTTLRSSMEASGPKYSKQVDEEHPQQHPIARPPPFEKDEISALPDQ